MRTAHYKFIVALIAADLAVSTALWPAWFRALVDMVTHPSAHTLEWAAALAVALLTVLAVLIAASGLRDLREARASTR